MSYQRYVKAIIYIAVLAWTVVLWLNHDPIHSAWLKPLSTVITIVIYVVIVFDLWLWKLSLLRWFVKRPVIEGTWRVEIRSNWIDPQTGLSIKPILAFMAVRQTLSTLSMRLMTAESTSVLAGTEIVCSPDGLYCVSGVYRNEPRFEVRSRSEIHYGGLWLQIAEDSKAKTMVGHYWTDRNTAGSMILTSQRAKLFQSFAVAEAAFRHGDK
jgi:SMODS-associating 2TM, beta-strand rich effector domain